MKMTGKVLVRHAAAHIARRSLVVALLGAAALTSPAAAQGEPSTVPGLLTSVSALAARLSDPSLVLIRAERDSVAPSGDQIPGTRFLPLKAFVVTRNGLVNELPSMAQLDSVMESVGISDGSRVVIYGDALASARLFLTLDYMGLGGQVSLLDGSLPAWRAANQPVAAATSAHAAGRLSPRAQPGLIVDVAELARTVGKPSLLLLDARPAAEYSGATPGEGITRPGHIPGAKNFFWRNALATGEPALMKDVPELRRLLGEAGLTPNMDVVAYCRTGVQASYLYFVLRYLGYKPRVYDGSFAEWSQGTERAVER